MFDDLIFIAFINIYKHKTTPHEQHTGRGKCEAIFDSQQAIFTTGTSSEAILGNEKFTGQSRINSSTAKIQTFHFILL